MRVISEKSDGEIKITVFAWNEKILLKFESGMYEQTYKVKEMDISGEGDVTTLLKNAEFIASVRTRFREMHKDFVSKLDL